jgi:hypothetical protein
VAIERGVAAQNAAVECGFEFVRGGDRAAAEGRCDIRENVVIDTIHGQIDAEAPLGAIDELLAEGNADVGNREALAVAHDRRHRENAEQLPPGFDADNRLSGLVRLHHGLAPRRDVLAEDFWRVNAEEGGRRRGVETDQRDTLRLQRLHRAIKQRHQRIAVALGDGIRHRGQIGDDGTDGEGRAPLIVEGGHHAVILQLELLIESEPSQRALLNNRKGPEDAAGHRNAERDSQDQAGRDRSKFEHGGMPKLRESRSSENPRK